MSDVLDEDATDEPRGASLARRIALALGLFGIVGAGVFVVMKFLEAPATAPPRVQNIALIKQPPPPPPKPPEKPPEPPKVKIEEPKDVPKPADPKPADEKPAADKPLGVDADATGSGDAFGLAANKGGRDITLAGSGGSGGTGGGGGAYYSGLLQRAFFDALSRNRKMLGEEFRVVVRIWLGDDGRVQKADIVNGSGKPDVDEMIQVTLLDMTPLRDVPPSSMRPMQLRLSNRS